MIAAPILNELSDSPAATVLDTDANGEGAFQSLLENHLPLVRSIVERMRRKLPSKIEADELYSIGVTGLVAAARNYRPSRESSFASYATTRIRGAILDELRLPQADDLRERLANTTGQPGAPARTASA